MPYLRINKHYHDLAWAEMNLTWFNKSCSVPSAFGRRGSIKRFLFYITHNWVLNANCLRSAFSTRWRTLPTQTHAHTRAHAAVSGRPMHTEFTTIYYWGNQIRKLFMSTRSACSKVHFYMSESVRRTNQAFVESNATVVEKKSSQSLQVKAAKYWDYEMSKKVVWKFVSP